MEGGGWRGTVSAGPWNVGGETRGGVVEWYFVEKRPSPTFDRLFSVSCLAFPERFGWAGCSSRSVTAAAHESGMAHELGVVARCLQYGTEGSGGSSKQNRSTPSAVVKKDRTGRSSRDG